LIQKLLAQLAAGRGGNHDGVGVDFWNAEVAAEVDQIERTQLTGDVNDAHVTGGAGEHGDAVDVGAGEVEPEVGDGAVGLGGVGGTLVSADEVLPACGVVGGDDGAHGLWCVKGRAGITIVVDGDAGERGGGAIGVHAVREEKVLGDLEHGAVEAEGSVAGGLVGKRGEALIDVRRLLGEREGSCESGAENCRGQEFAETVGHRGPRVDIDTDFRAELPSGRFFELGYA
jgi:hypothetical protein